MALCVLLAIMPAVASDFTLQIFGNANMDDTIDELDIEYVQGILDGSNEETELADANYDGEVDDEDIEQIEQILNGDNKELTLTDSANRTVTLKTPIRKVVVARMGPHEPAIILAKDRIVGISEGIKQYRKDIVERTGIMDMPSVGYSLGGGLDYEKIIELDPDLVLITSETHLVEEVPNNLPTTIPVVSLDFDRAGAKKMASEIQMLGTILGEKEKADELTNFILKYEGIVEDRTADLGDDDKPFFYIETYADFVTYGSNAYDGSVAAGCGGRNIVDGVGFTKGQWGEVTLDPEWVLSQNPDVIFMRNTAYTEGFKSTDEDFEDLIKSRINRAGWDDLDAVKDGRVYMYNDELCFSPRYIIGRLTFAKWLHPDLFEDIDPEEIHAEYWKQFLGVDLTGTWTYPGI